MKYRSKKMFPAIRMTGTIPIKLLGIKTHLPAIKDGAGINLQSENKYSYLVSINGLFDSTLHIPNFLVKGKGVNREIPFSTQKDCF